MPNRRSSSIAGYTLILISLLSIDLIAQSWDVHAGAGFASYSHSEMKEYQQLIHQQLQSNGITPATTEDFPPYVYYFAGFSRAWTKWYVGVEGGHGSTGGRVYYGDYSGSYTADQSIQYNYLAIDPAKIFKDNSSILFMGGAKITFTRSTLKINNDLTVGNSTVNENATFYSLNLGLQPYVLLRKYLGKSFFIQTSAGYELQNNSELRKSDDKDLWLNDGGGEPVHLQGNGFRISVSTGFKFSK